MNKSHQRPSSLSATDNLVRMNPQPDNRLEALVTIARASARRCDDHRARQAIHAIAARDLSTAVVLASELYGNAIGWLFPEPDDRE